MEMNNPVAEDIKEETAPERESKGIPELTNEQQEALAEQLTPLFQESYRFLYDAGLFENLVKTIKGGGKITISIAQTISDVLNSMIKDTGLIDIVVIFNLGLMILGDLVDSLGQSGVDVESLTKEDADEIISTTVTNVLNNNPEVAKEAAQNPGLKEMMSQGSQGPQGPPQGSGVMGSPEEPQGPPGGAPSAMNQAVQGAM